MPVEQLALKLLGKNHGQSDLPLLKGRLQVGIGPQVFYNIKIAACFQPVHNGSAGLVFCIVQHGNAGILDLVGQGKPKNKYLGHRHAKKDEQCPPVAQEVVKFLSDEV